MTDQRNGPIGEDDLQAFIDDRLPEARRVQVETYLSEHPEIRDRVLLDRSLPGQPARQARRQIRRADPAAFAHRKYTFGPPANHYIDGFKRSRQSSPSLLRGVVSGWMAAYILPPTAPLNTATVADNATTAFRTFVVEVAHPVEVAAAQEEHLLRWLSKRLGRPLVAPNLSKFGYQLIGGRLLSANEGAAAQLMYEDSSGQRLTIYVQAEQGSETAFRYWQAGDASTFAWIDQRVWVRRDGPSPTRAALADRRNSLPRSFER